MAADAAHAPNHQPKAKIFISYSRKDVAFADRLDAALKARGFEPLIDRQDPIALQDWSKGIAPFEDWWKRIETLITKADTIVFVLSPDAVTSKVALDEIKYAASLNKRFAPVVCRQVEDSSVPDELRRLNFVFFEDATRFDASADRLATALQIDLDWLRRHSEYGELALRWAGAGRPGPQGLLLRSPLLEEAERWMASRPQTAPAPTEATLAFVVESRRATNRRRRQTWTLACSLAAAIVAGGVAAWWNQDRLRVRSDEFQDWVKVRSYAFQGWLKERNYALWNAHPLKTAQERRLKSRDPFKECSDCPEMVVVPAGRFMMGSPDGQGNADEHPQHAVTITKSFAVSRYELTFDQWDVCSAQGSCKYISDERHGRGQRPAINLGWYDAQSYVAWLSRITGQEYRLLSEAEYEYAARAGAQTVYPWGDDIGNGNANCRGCGSQWDTKRTVGVLGGETAPVGSFAANGFGLYDMVGNVSEWTEDCYHDSYAGAPVDGTAWTGGDCGGRVVRGGGFDSSPTQNRSASRSSGEWVDVPTEIRVDRQIVLADRQRVLFALNNLFKGFRVGRTLVTP
jgi:formylglycine-generating enzyme required for sulfatase activity